MKQKNKYMQIKTIPVFFSTDDNYVPYLVVALQSLVENSKNKYNYEINILNTGINNENKKALKDFEKSNIHIKFVDVSIKIKSIYKKLVAQLRDYYSPSIYYRLFIPTLFPKYKKALYLDCDIVILDDIAKLYNTDLKGNMIGATVDQVVSVNEDFKYYTDNALGVENTKYFNSGVILMDLDKFRAADVENKFIYLLNNYNFGSVAPDQDYLNVLCKDRVLYLDKGWDKMPIPDAEFNIKDLKLVHYNMFQKPWKYKDVLYEEYFWDFAKRTHFYDLFVNVLKNYSDEDKKRDAEASIKLLAYAREIAESDNSFKMCIEREHGIKNINVLDCIYRHKSHKKSLKVKIEEPINDDAGAVC